MTLKTVDLEAIDLIYENNDFMAICKPKEISFHNENNTIGFFNHLPNNRLMPHVHTVVIADTGNTPSVARMQVMDTSNKLHTEIH